MLGEPSPLLDQLLVHHAYLACRPAKTDKPEFEPVQHSFNKWHGLRLCGYFSIRRWHYYYSLNCLSFRVDLPTQWHTEALSACGTLMDFIYVKAINSQRQNPHPCLHGLKDSQVSFHRRTCLLLSSWHGQRHARSPVQG